MVLLFSPLLAGQPAPAVPVFPVSYPANIVPSKQSKTSTPLIVPILPLLQTWIGANVAFLAGFVVPGACLAYLFLYALVFSKNVNPDIKID